VGLGLIDWPFASAEGYWRWVDLCEVGGIDSLWQSDRLVGAQPALECLSVMAALAGRTRRLKFGMSVLSLGWREPLVVAKACATIDFLSGGRLLPAFGLGSLVMPEWKALGRAPEGQGGAFDEALEVISRLWRGETVDFQGRHLTVTGARISPLPAQAELPLWIGGSSAAAVRRTARYGTGWLAGIEAPEAAGVTVAQIKAAAAELGRTIDPDHFGGSFFFRLLAPGESADPAAWGLPAAMPAEMVAKAVVAGTAAEVLARIRAFEAVGVTKLVLRPLARGDVEVLAQTERLIAEVLPGV
jgi:probable F420-dependent oxidoreductase